MLFIVRLTQQYDVKLSYVQSIQLHHPNSQFKLSTNRGHTPPIYGIRPQVHREVPNPRP